MSETIKLEHHGYGLGYPPGYRACYEDVGFNWRDRRFDVTVETHYDFHEGHDVTSESAGWVSPCTLAHDTFFWNVYPENPESNSWTICVRVPELDWEIVEEAIRRFLVAKGADHSLSFLWEWRDEEDELRTWHEDQEQSIAWLRDGASPCKVILADTFLESMAKSFDDSAQELREFWRRQGFSENEEGVLQSNPDEIDHGPAELFERTLANIAHDLGDDGPRYLSSASWPLISFVSGGRRFDTTPNIFRAVNVRAWFGYLERSKKVVLMFSQTRVRLIDVPDEPDFKPALRQFS